MILPVIWIFDSPTFWLFSPLIFWLFSLPTSDENARAAKRQRGRKGQSRRGEDADARLRAKALCSRQSEFARDAAESLSCQPEVCRSHSERRSICHGPGVGNNAQPAGHVRGWIPARHIFAQVARLSRRVMYVDGIQPENTPVVRLSYTRRGTNATSPMLSASRTSQRLMVLG